MLITSNWICFSQSDSVIVYQWSELGDVNPDTIYGLSFSKMKLTALPEKLVEFKNLRELDLSKNKLNSLPDFIGDLLYLEILDISKNELSNFPVEVCKLSNLKKLIANRNSFDRIPECIGFCTKLELIDLWDTPIAFFPLSISNLKNLKVIDLQGIRYGPTFQKDFRNAIPWVTIKFDAPCDCME